jgi:glycerol-3-phosphate acyltransferase PlsY
MTDVIVMMLSALAAYLLGSIPTGYIIAKLFGGIDIRKFGSSNVGATNVFRVTGKIPGIATLLLDMLKGVLAVTLLADFSYAFTSLIDYEFFRCLLGLAAICGHIWSAFLKFTGGKGVATTIGVMAICSPPALALSLVIWAAVFAATNYVSLGSLAFGIALPVLSVFFGASVYVVLLAVTICILNTYKHKANIKRLLRGEENKTYLFKKTK